MKDVLSVMQNYIKAYKDNDKQCFESLGIAMLFLKIQWVQILMNGIVAISAFWDFGHSSFSIIPRDESFIVCGDEGIIRAVMQLEVLRMVAAWTLK